MTAIGDMISIVPDDVRTIRERFRTIAAGSSENCALMLAVGTKPAELL